MADQWERVIQGPGATLYRLKVPTGWLVYGVSATGAPGGQSMAVQTAFPSITFVPDPGHQWISAGG
jgi:hypothetical protein